MWGLRWKQGEYRLENLDAKRMEQIRQGERECHRNLTAIGICVWCGVRPAAPNDPRGACTECDDMLCNCC